MLIVLDYFLSVFHVFFILFCIFGLFFRPLRKIHLICLILTAFSWFGLGAFYGMGYCPLTDWHWRIKYSLGEYGISGSFIHYAITNYLSIDLSPLSTNILTLSTFLILLISSTILNIKQVFSLKDTE